jgi:uncharacterized RDD family membrane protein YckC
LPVPAPEKLTIETPEQVSLEFTLASVGSRFLALGLDTLLQAAAIVTVLLLAFGLSRVTRLAWSGVGPWVAAAVGIAFFVLYYGYFAAFEIGWSGQTPGKRIVGLRVLGVAGHPVSPYQALLRNVVRIADQMPGIYAIGILFVLVTDRNQRLGDLAAGTVVVHEHPIEEQDAPADSRAARATHGAHRLAPDEIAVIETFLRRRSALTAYGRLHAARQIAERLKARLNVTAIGDEEVFLEEVIAEYRAAGRYR